MHTINTVLFCILLLFHVFSLISINTHDLPSNLVTSSQDMDADDSGKKSKGRSRSKKSQDINENGNLLL